VIGSAEKASICPPREREAHRPATPLSATATKLARHAVVEEQTLAVVRQILNELGGRRGLEELAARGSKANLERELGLGSLERVELMLRLGDGCGVRLPDRVVAEADTVSDLVEAILRAEGNPAAAASNFSPDAAGAARAISTSAAPELAEPVRRAATLTEIIRLRGRGEPGRAHIRIYEEDDSLRTITFGELYERSSRVAFELRRRGLDAGQTVAIMLPTCADFFYTFAGVLLAGGIPVPIYPPFRADRIAEYAARQSNILKNAEVRFLITWRQAEGLANLLKPRVPTLREVLNAQKLSEDAEARPVAPLNGRPVENLSHQAHAEDIAFLQYTSGSTGSPKGVVLTHANLLANIRAIVSGIEIRTDDVAVSWLPLYHDMGLIGAWFVPLFTGIPLVVMSPLAFLSRPERWLRAIDRHRATISPAPNFAYELCVRKIPDKDLEGLDLSSWRAATNGAEPVRSETLDRFAKRFAAHGFHAEALTPVYGLAEGALAVSVPKLGAGYRVDRIDRGAFELERRAVPAAASDAGALEFVNAGKPLPSVEVRIVDPDGHDLGERSEGRLWFRGPSATSGYYKNPEATAALMRDGNWLDSGDYAYWADGELFITGRAKDIIIKGGRNLYPHELEEIAGRVEGVRTGCVVAFGAPDERSGTERLVIAAEVRDMANANRIEGEITKAVDDAIGMPPDVVRLLAPGSIPKTSSGKLRRSDTRRLFLEGKLGQKPQKAAVQIAALGASSVAPRVAGWLRTAVRETGEFFYGAYALCGFAAILVPLWARLLFARDPERAARILRGGAQWMLKIAGVGVDVKGREILAAWPSEGPWIFAPNHSSYIDVLVALAVLPAGVRFVAKGEVSRMPLVGTIARSTHQFLFDRSDADARIRQAEEVNAALRGGTSVAIYPEGTFTEMTGIRPFQLGAFKSAVDTGRPICPVSIRGARQILRDKTTLPRRGRVTLTFGELITPDASAGDDWHEIVRLRDAARELIARNSGEPLL
jgi:fatty-acyl-CoA synthase